MAIILAAALIEPIVDECYGQKLSVDNRRDGRPVSLIFKLIACTETAAKSVTTSTQGNRYFE